MSVPILDTTEGKILGKICKTENDVAFYVYKGIPFAKPPVGELRFSVPEQPEPWEGVRDATKECSICPQFDIATGSVIGNEDCLYLNVYTPTLSKDSLLPVMVFVHGGGFVFGNGTDDATHGADYLVEKDVVVVSFNYRLGILGFLSLDTKDAPGNMGLRDQVAALKWVKKNIYNFGGDQNNVTIFGVSAGGASIEYLLLSPMAKGLFHKAIAQSGSSLLQWAQNKKIKELAAMIPIAKDKPAMNDIQLLRYLKIMPIKDLICSSMDAINSLDYKGGISFGFVPTIEKKGDWEQFLSDDTYTLLDNGNFTKVPYIVGICSHEGLLMVSHKAERLKKFTKEKDFINFFPFDIDECNKTEIANRLKGIYLDGPNHTEDSEDFAIDFFGDTDFIGGVYTAAALIAKSNAPVYFYEFAYDGGLNYLKRKYSLNRKGTCHGDDGGYLLKSACLSGPLTKTDALVRDRMVTMWTNFAKHGNPTPKQDDVLTTIWEPFTKTKSNVLRIDDKMTVQSNLYPDRTDLYEECYKKFQ